MKIIMHNAPGYGASPERVEEFGYDKFTAAAIMQAVAANRARARAFAELFCDDVEAHGLWPAELHGALGAAPARLTERRARFAAALDELLDDFLHQGKVAEAEEVA